MKISVIYVTNRPGGIDILKDNLDRQTFRDFELIIVDDLFNWREREVAEYLKNYKPIHIKPRCKRIGDAWNLNKAYNDGFAVCNGDLIVSLQDYIWVSAIGLERFWHAYELHKDALVTGVGHKAKYPEKGSQKGKISLWKSFKKPEGISELDDRLREPKIGLEESNYSYWELNWSSIPRKWFFGFDEDMDTHYGGDNVIVSAKAQAKGAKIYVDYSNKIIGYNQKLFPRPEDWEEKHANKGKLNEKLCQIL